MKYILFSFDKREFRYLVCVCVQENERERERVCLCMNVGVSKSEQRVISCVAKYKFCLLRITWTKYFV